MKLKLCIVFTSLLFILFHLVGYAEEKPAPAPIKPVTEEYFGVEVVDPYRYMENLDDPQVQEWFKTHSDYSRSTLDRIKGRQSLIDKMREFDQRKSSRISYLRITDNDVYFYLKTTPGDETGKLYTRNGYEGEEIFLYDPQSFSQDSTQKYVITSVAPSDDGSKVAFEVAPDGSESTVLLIMNVNDKTLYPEQIDRCWFAFTSWLPDGSGFLFNRLQSSDLHDKDREKDSKSYLHMLGTNPDEDVEIFSRGKYPELGIKPEDFPIVTYDKDSGYLYGFAYSVDSRLTVFYTPASELEKSEMNWTSLFTIDDQVYDFNTTKADLYVLTPKDASNFKILKTSLQNPNLETAEMVVPEHPEATITTFGLTNEALYYTLSKNGVEEKAYRLPFGMDKAIELDPPLSAGSVSLSTKGFKFSDVWFGLSGWTSDYQRYRYLAETDEFKLENLSATAEYPEYTALVVEELMIPSHDGVKVPLSLIYKKGTKKNSANPVFLYGYGAYGMSINPFFSANFLLWTHHDGILAVAHVRGGGELGEQWHKAGFKSTKPNTWKDLISCAEFLITEEYTSADHIAINGGSAGGILVGRAMTERPDLFAAAIPEVGCLNPLRAEESPNGPVNVPEFGTVQDSIECMALIEMDAYLHVNDGEKYPATLVTAGMNDPRVIAWQPAKFAARLQTANASNEPVLFLADFESGHGIGDTKTKRFENLADIFSFALWQTEHPKFQSK